MSIPTTSSISINGVSLVSKNARTMWASDYCEVLSNGKVIKLAIDDTVRNTTRGIYDDFAFPSANISHDLTCVGEYATSKGAPLGNKKTLQIDLVLDLMNSSDNMLYQTLCKFECELHEHIAKALTTRDGELAKYLSKTFGSGTDTKDMIKCNFMRDNKGNENIKYVHLKVSGRSNFFNDKGEAMDQDFLCYKSFMIMPIVVVDNIRVPSSRVKHEPRLVVNLHIDSAIVKAYSPTSKYGELMSVMNVTL